MNTWGSPERIRQAHLPNGSRTSRDTLEAFPAYSACCSGSNARGMPGGVQTRHRPVSMKKKSLPATANTTAISRIQTVLKRSTICALADSEVCFTSSFVSCFLRKDTTPKFSLDDQRWF